MSWRVTFWTPCRTSAAHRNSSKSVMSTCVRNATNSPPGRFSLPPIEIGCCRFRSLYGWAETRVYAVSAGGGLGWGSGACGTAVQHSSPPPPTPPHKGEGRSLPRRHSEGKRLLAAGEGNEPVTVRHRHLG